MRGLLSYFERSTLEQMAREQKKRVVELKENDFLRPDDFAETGLNFCYVGEVFEGQVKDHKAGMLRNRNRVFLRFVEVGDETA